MYAVYRLFDDADDLLYVGVSTKPHKRFHQHASDKWWWNQVVRKDITWFELDSTASFAEKTAIESESPRYNVAGVSMSYIRYVARRSVDYVDTPRQSAVSAELARAVAVLRQTDNERAGELIRRDSLLERAMAKGSSWSRVQELTGLTPRGVQQALRRAREFRAKG